MKKLRLAVLAAAILLPASAFAQFSVTVHVGENCNGRLTNSAGFSGVLPCAVTADPGPGGLPNAVTYDLLNPPGLTAGDLIILEPGGGISDIIRFNPSQIGAGGGAGTLVFYSDNVDGIEDLADTGFPGSLYANNFTVFEVGPENGTNGFLYTPVAGQPGFVTGAGGPVTYDIISDTPEPASLGLMLAGAGVLVGKLVRRKSA